MPPKVMNRTALKKVKKDLLVSKFLQLQEDNLLIPDLHKENKAMMIELTQLKNSNRDTCPIEEVLARDVAIKKLGKQVSEQEVTIAILQNQIDSTKINHITALQNEIDQQIEKKEKLIVQNKRLIDLNDKHVAAAAKEIKELKAALDLANVLNDNFKEKITEIYDHL